MFIASDPLVFHLQVPQREVRMSEVRKLKKTRLGHRSMNIYWASLVAQTVKNLSAMQENQVRSLGWEDPLEEGMIFLPGESHGQRSLAGCTPWGRRIRRG